MQRIQVTVFSGVSILLINAVYSMNRCNPPSYGTNGCSIPWNLSLSFKDVFEPACDEQAVCYACGESNGLSRRSCDSKFWDDMQQICKSDSRVKNEKDCLSMKKFYWIGARLFGGSYYSNPSSPWCNETWVPSCLS